MLLRDSFYQLYVNRFLLVLVRFYRYGSHGHWTQKLLFGLRSQPFVKHFYYSHATPHCICWRRPGSKLYLPALEIRCPLFQEGLHGFFMVFGLAHLFLGHVGEVQAVFEVHFQASVDQVLD